MTAIGLTLVIFFVPTIIGLGLVALGSPRRSSQTEPALILIAPVLGVSLLIVTAAPLNRLGLPVSTFGPALVTVELAAALACIAWRRPRLPFGPLAAFAPILVATFFLSAAPMLTYGFNWIAYANDDGGNYVLAGARLLENGFSWLPDAARLLGERDMSLHYYFFQVITRERIGADLFLALVASCARTTTLLALTPTMVALLFVLVVASGALVVKRGWNVALCVSAAMSLSALTTFSTLAQLAAQALGLPQFVAAVVLLFDERLYDGRPRERIGRFALAALPVAGMTVCYPEFLVFLIAPLAVWLAFGLRAGSVRIAALIAPVAGLTMSVLALINLGIPWAIAELVTRTGMVTADSPFLFPLALMPCIFGIVWGFIPMFILAPDPTLSIAIIVGAVGLIAVAAGAVAYAVRREPIALVLLGFLIVGVGLFIKREDFPVFKVGLYLQAFLWAFVAIAATDGMRRIAGRFPAIGTLRPVAPTLAVIVALFALPCQQTYLHGSDTDRVHRPANISMILDGSHDDYIAALADAARSTHVPYIVSDATNQVMIKYESVFAQGKSLVVPGWDTYASFDAGPRVRNPADPISRWYDAFITDYGQDHPIRRFDLHSRGRGPQTIGFRSDETLRGIPERNIVLWDTAPLQSVLNRTGRALADDDIRVVPMSSVRNHLVLVNNDLASMVAWERRIIALTQPPIPDYPNRGIGTVQSFGRYDLFEIIHPSRRVRLIFELTEAANTTVDRRIPPVAVIGTTRQTFGTVGSGAARLISPPVEPQFIGGHAYIAVDMGRATRRATIARSPLMNAFNSDLPLDSRNMVGDARDFSLVDPDDDERLPIAARLDDLTALAYDPAAYYCGLYENGDLSDRVHFELRAGSSDEDLIIGGERPNIAGSVHVIIAADGKPLAHLDRAPGSFLIRVPTKLSPGIHQVDLRISGPAMKGADGRIVRARLTRIGFYDAQAYASTSLDIYDVRSGVELGRGWDSYDTFAGQRFRWMGNEAELFLPPATTARTLTLDAEPGPGVGSAPAAIAFHVDGGAITRTTLSTRGLVTFRVPAHPRALRAVIHIDNGGTIIPTDPRLLNLRIFRLTIDTPAGSSATPVTDDDAGIPLAPGVRLAGDWYPRETFAGETFHWARTDSHLLVAANVRRLKIRIEPGPSAARPLRLEITHAGRTVESLTVPGREDVSIPIDGPGAYGLHVLNGGPPVPGDPRPLEFRLFAVTD